MKVAFILLAHEKPEFLKKQIESILSSGADIYVHYDLSSSYCLKSESINWNLTQYEGVLYHAERIKVIWGEFSIVKATLNALILAMKHKKDIDYFMLISGSCMPTKPIWLLEEYLEENKDFDIIETVDATKYCWVKDGIQKERWENYHFFNWRYQPALFDASLKIQKMLNIKRSLPLDYIPYMGSQWWCLRRNTVEKIITLLTTHPKILNFYKKTWVPDELFFQTMVANLIQADEIKYDILTKYTFNSWGIPRVYYNDDFSEMIYEKTFFARKVSHTSHLLKDRLKNFCLLNKEKYNSIVYDKNHQLVKEYEDKKNFKQNVNDSSWFNLASYEENIYDFIHSIPNTIILSFVSSDEERNVVETFFNATFDDCVIFSNQFKTRLEQHNWHLKLGDFAKANKSKKLVWVLREDMLTILEYIRWKKHSFVYLFYKETASMLNLHVNILKELKEAHIENIIVPYELVMEKKVTSWLDIQLASNESAFEKNIYNKWLIKDNISYKSLNYVTDSNNTHDEVYNELFDKVKEKNMMWMDTRNLSDDAFYYYLQETNKKSDNSAMFFIMNDKQLEIIEMFKWIESTTFLLDKDIDLQNINLTDRLSTVYYVDNLTSNEISRILDNFCNEWRYF